MGLRQQESATLISAGRLPAALRGLAWWLNVSKKSDTSLNCVVGRRARLRLHTLTHIVHYDMLGSRKFAIKLRQSANPPSRHGVAGLTKTYTYREAKMAPDGKSQNDMIYRSLGNTGLKARTLKLEPSQRLLACVQPKQLPYFVVPTRRIVLESRVANSAALQVSALSYGAWVTFGTQVDVEQVGVLP